MTDEERDAAEEAYEQQQETEQKAQQENIPGKKSKESQSLFQRCKTMWKMTKSRLGWKKEQKAQEELQEKIEHGEYEDQEDSDYFRRLTGSQEMTDEERDAAYEQERIDREGEFIPLSPLELEEMREAQEAKEEEMRRVEYEEQARHEAEAEKQQKGANG